VVADVVIVGAGTAGCVAAYRLAASDKLNVALLEAGGEDSAPAIHDPKRLIELWGSKDDWNIVTEPSPGLNGRRIPIARGKVLGGCSSLFAMIHVRGNRRDFDLWNVLGADGWSYEECLPYFKRSETYYAGSSEFHGGEGPLPIRQNPKPTAVATAFCEAAVELGFDGPNWDHNGARQEDGAGLYTYTIFPNGTRASTAQTFLALARRTGRLQVITNAQATAVLLDSGRAVGVRYLLDGREQEIRAEREVIVCGGSFHSPHLLMLSGIGEAAALRALGIAVQQDLPGVGKNLQDHLLLPIFYHSRQDLPAPEFIAEAGLFVRTRPGMPAALPNLQFHFGAGLPAFTPPGLGAHFAFVPIVIQPLSRGQVRLKSPNPLDLPLVEPNYLAEPEDVRTLAAGVRLARRLAKTRAMSAINGGEAIPGEAVDSTDLDGFIRDHCSTVWHPAGTCAMGLDRMSVVDPQLRVHGVQRLRVADASVMPRITSGNTHAATVMIGERAADFVLAGL